MEPREDKSMNPATPEQAKQAIAIRSEYAKREAYLATLRRQMLEAAEDDEKLEALNNRLATGIV
jgi:hypothetical protein